MTVTASAYFNGARFADGEFGFVAFSTGQFGEGSGLFPASFGATFVKQYDLNQGSLNADESIGSPTATFTASRGATSPATTIEKQDGNGLLFDGVDDKVVVSDATAIQNIWNGGGSISINLSTNNPSVEFVPLSKRSAGKGWYIFINTSGTVVFIREASTTDGSWTATSTTAIDIDGGTNIIIVDYDDSSLSNNPVITVNGVISTFSAAISPVGTVGSDVGEPLDIGHRDTSSPFPGQIKDVKLYKSTGLVAHYDFSDGSGSTLTDVAGTNNGTITGAKWLTNNSTYITKVTADNTPRWTQGFYDDSGYNDGRGLLIEGARSNLLIHGIFDADTQGGNGWGWIDDVTNALTTTMVAETFTNISGSQALHVQQTFGDGSYTIGQSPRTAVGSVVQDDPVTVSLWIKGAVVGVTSLKLSIRENDAAALVGTAINGDDIKGDISSTEWRRFTLTHTSVDADCSRIQFWLTTEHPGSGSIDLQIAGAQVENAPYATSFIPTTSAALTRNAEVNKYVTLDNRTAATESVFIKFRPLGGDFANDGIARQLTDSDTKRRSVYKPTNNSDINTYANQTDSGSTRQNTSTPILSSTSYVSAGSMASTGNPNLQIYLDGTQKGSDDNDDFTANAWGTSFYIGSDLNGLSNVNAIIESVAFFNKALSATEVSTVTDILNK